jgi:hypothetical protein
MVEVAMGLENRRVFNQKFVMLQKNGVMVIYSPNEDPTQKLWDEGGTDK